MSQVERYSYKYTSNNVMCKCHITMYLNFKRVTHGRNIRQRKQRAREETKCQKRIDIRKKNISCEKVCQEAPNTKLCSLAFITLWQCPLSYTVPFG